MKKILLLLLLFISVISFGQNTHILPVPPATDNYFLSAKGSAAGGMLWAPFQGFNPGYIDVTAAPFLAKGDLTELYDGAITGGTNIFTSLSATFTLADVGKSIYIGDAGASGARFITTISGFTNSHTVTLTANATTTVSAMDYKYGTDNTPLIQAAINYGVSISESPIVFFNSIYGTRYGLFSAPQTSVNGVNPNCQIYIPLSPYTASDTMHAVTLMGNGEGNYYIDFAANQTYPFAGIFLESIRMDSAANVIGSPWGSYVYGNFNYTHLHLQNIGVIVSSRNGNTDVKPFLTAINANNIAFSSLENVIVRTESSTLASVKPDSACHGYVTPQINNGGNNDIRNFLALNFHDGIIVNENTNGDNIMVAACYYGLKFLSSNHASHFSRVLLTWEPFSIKTVGTAKFSIDQAELEEIPVGGSNPTAWWNYQACLDDAGSTPIGKINYYTVFDGGGGYNQYLFARTLSGNADLSNLVIQQINQSLPWTQYFTVVEYRVGSDSLSNGLTAAYTLNGALNNAVNITYKKDQIAHYAIGIDPTAAGLNDFYEYNYINSQYDQYTTAAGNMQFAGTDAKSAPLLTLSRSDTYGHLANVPALSDSSDKLVNSKWIKQQAYGSGGGGGGSQFTTNGNDVYLTNTAGNVAVGTTTTSDGRIHAENNQNAGTFIKVKNTSNGASSFSGIELESDGSGIAYIYRESSGNSSTGSASDLVIQNPSHNIDFYVQSANHGTFNGSGLLLPDLAGSGTRLVTATSTGQLQVSSITIASGSYTPTLTNTTNITTSTLDHAYYTQIGNIVTVTVAGVITPTAATGIVITFTLPITTSNGTQNYVGTGVQNQTTSWLPGMVNIVSTTTGTFQMIATSFGFSQAFSCTFQYSL